MGDPLFSVNVESELSSFLTMSSASHATLEPLLRRSVLFSEASKITGPTVQRLSNVALKKLPDSAHVFLVQLNFLKACPLEDKI